ncbi:uncharacterized protein LOC107262049 isoform X1 [Ricinus communis]|uniref:uncharacterized protein LOC107262049 isoform X1 n=1 Tax=Ricinus communis TaxID=3988 RepID=UPI00201AB034|nr:uncharacterized protein LOC107262049 isoform X1 [Ricinus communis]XP_048234143.1 uncharacterized protein LOC107262049 isoform X1 [Ricinus communis]XP_048234144.1 uncharacterized protein LOC107262049 isoform X1 [Ricinus communis]
MALPIVKGLLQQYVQSLFDEGIVNDQFLNIQTLKTVEEPDRVMQLINTYCIDVEAILLELTSDMDLPEVNFSNMEALARQIEEKSLYVGAGHMRLSCVGLIQACRDMQKRSISRELDWMKNEFACTRNKLQVFVQTERKILRLERKQQK